MSELQTLQEMEWNGATFRIYGTVESPLFLAADVAVAIDYFKNANGSRQVNKMLQDVDENEKVLMTFDICDGIPSQNTTTNINQIGQKRWFLTEDGLYEVLMMSKLPKAKEFKTKVKEILRTIRKTGSFAIQQPSREQRIAAALIDANEIIAEMSQENKVLKIENAAQKEVIEVQVKQLEVAQPKVEYFDQVLQCEDAIIIGKIAQDYGWSAIEMNKFLHEKGVQYKIGGVWRLYRKYADKGYTTLKTHVHLSNGKPTSSELMCWTQKGRHFIYELLKSFAIFPLSERYSKIEQKETTQQLLTTI